MNATRERWLQIAGHVLTAGYLIAAAALLVWAGWRRFQLPQEPIIDPDIEGYLGPAISALGGKGFVHLMGRSFPYPAFVYLILRVFGDFRAIAVAQHLLGMAAGGLVLLAWSAAGALVPEGGIPKPLFRFMGLGPAYIYLGSATAISFEHQIRPEAIFSFLAILNIWLSLRFLESRFVRRRESFIWLGALNVFVSVLMYLAKPSFGFATLFCTLPVWLSLILPGASRRQTATLGVAAILPAFLFLILPEQVLKKSDPGATLFLPETLISAHAAPILEQMTEDLAGKGLVPEPRNILQAARNMLAAELATASRLTAAQADNSLGYKPDYLILEYLQYDSSSFCVRFPSEMHLSNREMADFCMTWYLRALSHHPGLLAAQAKAQLAIFYARKNPVYWLGRNLNLSALQYGRVAGLMALTSQFAPGNATIHRYIETCERLAGESVAIPQAPRFVEWLRMLSSHYLDLLWVALLCPLLLLSRRLRAHFLWAVAAVWLVYSYNFGNCLTIAVVHSLEVTRYVRIQLIFTVFAQCLSLYLLLELAVFGIRAGIGRVGAPDRANNQEHEAPEPSK